MQPSYRFWQYLFFTGTLFLLFSQKYHAFDHHHQKWTDILANFCDKKGKVNYRGLKKDSSSLETYIGELKKVPRSEFDSWEEKQKLAYWINAYNAFTIRIILQHYPIHRAKGLKARLYPENSIRQIPGVWDKIKLRVGGRDITLGDIEHEILRKEFHEPRIHFAIVCASIGCPSLFYHAYEADAIDQQLEKSAKRFIRDREKVRFDLRNNKIYVSKIFQWFYKDFGTAKETKSYGKYSGVVHFILQRFSKPIQNQIQRNNLDIDWLEYDWSLNE